ncbi:MAG TPA: hypothetical protein VGO09_02600, partial [Flavisolibacter sp.]|nr:hypothetical protein [Flavisolibacter sp.]
NYLNTADAEYERMSLNNLLKDSALAAFALYIASNARHQRILEDEDYKDEIKVRAQRQEVMLK